MEGGPEADISSPIDREPRPGEAGWRDESFFEGSQFKKDKVFIHEIPEIIKRRRANGVLLGGLEPWKRKIDKATETDTPLPHALAELKPSPRLGFVGLALSGGGIRSGAFNLGVIQQLVEKEVVHHVDYLSTVSGGGYLGACVESMLAAHDRHPLPLRHVPGRTEQNAFLHLRDYSNYLAPGGVREVLRIPALIVQGILVNLLWVLPYLLIAAIFLGGLALGMVSLAAAEGSYLDLPIKGIAVAFLAMAAYLAVILPSWQHWREGRSPHEQRWWIREKQSNLAKLGLLFVPVALALLQPAILLNIAKEGWVGTFAAIGGFGGAGLAVALGQRATQRLPGLMDKLLVIGFALLAPISLWLLMLALAKWLLCPPAWVPFSEEARRSCTGQSWTHVSLFLVAIYVAVGAFIWYYAFRILDANKTSFHAFYRDRLSKAYLFDPYRDAKTDHGGVETGESKTGLKHTDRIRLSHLPGRGPYHLINAAINIQDAKTANMRGRNADFFLFSRLYCGGELTGYCKTEELEKHDPHLDLATAMAISGAAAAPNMGLKTNRAWTFTLAMANVRLGYWLRNPNKIAPNGVQARRRQPRAGRRYFFKELFGWLTDEDEFVYVSDGGHIENLGGLELLRRRCRYIIISDAEADPTMTLNGLANLMRLARIDLGIDITIDVVDIRCEPPGTVRSHCAVGTIDYGRNEYGRREFGKLLYIKASITGDENEYITEYRSRHPNFPHETTGDQFFDEAQFEAYRALGYHIVRGLFQPRRSEDLIEAFSESAGFVSVEQWFEELTERLRPLPPDRNAFIDLQKQIAGIERRLTERVFASYSDELYPEVKLTPRHPALIIPHGAGLKEEAASFATERAEETTSLEIEHITPEELERRVLHLVNEQLQLIERAVLQLGLDDPRRRQRSSNRGFMNLFRRWSQSDSFRRAWAVSISNYSRNLQRFSDEALNLRLETCWTPWHERVPLRDVFETARKLRSKMKRQPEALGDESLKRSCPMQAYPVGDDINEYEWGNVLSHVWNLSDKSRWGPATDISDTPSLLIARIGVEKTLGVTSEKADKLRFTVGFAIVLDDANEPVVTYIRVRNTYRGLGLGFRLAQALKANLGEKPAPQFAIDDDSDVAAMMRSAFQQLGYREIHLGAGDHAIS